MNEPIRVAQIIGAAYDGGVESVIMNYYKYIDRSKVQFDFLVESESKIINKEEIEKMGGRVIIIPSYKKLFAYNKTLKKLFKENNYNIVHSNMNTLSVFPLRVAKKCGIKIRIAHSHSTSNKKELKRNILKNILRPFAKVYATHYFACSELAGRYLFGNKTYNKGKVILIKNGVEIERFLFDLESREKVREKLNIKNKFVIGHIGRFVVTKNHDFLLEAYNELCKKRSDTILLLVGTGPLIDKIKEKVSKYSLEEKVIFVGTTKNPEEYYNAMDLFAFPSLYEGLGMVAVEAQINGLPCIASINVPKEAKVLENCERLFLNKDEWVKKFLECKTRIEVNTEDFAKKGYSIENEAKKLLNKYIILVGSDEK